MIARPNRIAHSATLRFPVRDTSRAFPEQPRAAPHRKHFTKTPTRVFEFICNLLARAFSNC